MLGAHPLNDNSDRPPPQQGEQTGHQLLAHGGATVARLSALPTMAAVSLVKESAAWVSERATHVRTDSGGLERMAKKLGEERRDGLNLPKWNFDAVHFADSTPLTAQYLLVVDSLNFCFWPDPDFHYSHLAGGIRDSLLKDPSCLGADALSQITGPQVRQLIAWHRPLPLEEERARLLREVGTVLQDKFHGSAAELIRSAQGSAVALVDILSANFRGFQDHSIYKGRQVAFYKRAQIFAADVWGAYEGKGLGSFRDIGELTMFADYLVPQILHDSGALTFSEELRTRIARKDMIPPGSEEETELRSCSIQAVERLKIMCSGNDGSTDQVSSIELDWWLWAQGINAQEGATHHHRTLTVYY